MKKKDLEIIIGWRCNNNCMFCSNPEMKKILESRGVKEIDINLIKTTLVGYNSDEIDTLVFVGGEPTIIDGLFELIDFAINLGFKKIFLMTNGRMLSNDSFLKRLLKYPQIELGISIHGHSSDIHDYLTRSENSFKQALRGMDNLKNIGKKFMTNSVINKKNYESLPEMVRFLSGYNPDLMLFSFPWPKGNAMDNFDEIIPVYSEIKDKLIESLELGKNLNQNIKVMDVPFCILGDNYDFMHELDIERERDIVTHAFDVVTYGQSSGREKMKCQKCQKCQFFEKCEGVWGTYAEVFGFDEFKPVDI
ncbi:MAG: radical SAM protein [Candidatus Peregrinibacteria bacterium]|nr:radical SAM protein [Candidatus Peregrinibacteria bacterium]